MWRIFNESRPGLVIGFFALCFDMLMRYVEQVLVPWKGKV